MAEKLRVAVLARGVFPAHGLGGLERHVFDLVEHLGQRGVVVTLISRPGVSPDAWRARPKVLAVRYLTFPYAGRRWTTILDRDTAYLLFGWRAGRVAADLVRRREIDLVYGLGASCLGYACARPTHTAPLVFNPQGLEEFGATDPNRAPLKRLAYWPLRRAVLACAQSADRVVATDQTLVAVVEHHLGVGEERVVLLPNAIDLAKLDAAADPRRSSRLRASTGVETTGRVLLSVGRLEESKGFQVLARALSGLPTRNWRWVLVGDGPFRPQIERSIVDGGLDSLVRLTGAVAERDLHAWYGAADLFVHPTLYEGSSLVTLEAMGHRRPIVASRAGGLPDKVFPGVNGWLVEPGNVQALSRALEEALADGALAEKGRASRLIVEERFAWTSVAAQHLEVYARLIDRARVSAAQPST